jgi:putative hydrolase of the HAD superfamily
MIRNIIFDMVGVVIRFETEKYYIDHNISIPDRELLKRELFGSVEWARQDRGTIRDEDVIESVCVRVPERLHCVVRDFARRENRDILQVEGMEDLLADLKMCGYKVFLLSNTSNGFHRFWPQVGLNKWFDGTMISADEGLVKPDPAIFRLACERFQIWPEESVFIDDTPMNVEAAEYVGIKGFLYRGDIRELRDWLKETGVAFQDRSL